jgi:dihydrodipicolinate synthase/N-acetylneuraminate lyase
MSPDLSEMPPLDPVALLRPRRKITGMSAVLLPFTARGEVDWESFQAHLLRTSEAGLVPAVNMDTGYVNLLDIATRKRVLSETHLVLGQKTFIAGAFVADRPGEHLDLDSYRRESDLIQTYGGMPIFFQSFGLVALSGEKLLDAYRAFAKHCSAFLAFELGQMFAPFGRVYDLATYAGLLDIPECRGAKHSSLVRALEWQRLVLRDDRRPDFMVLTGNDLAIDMVMYGSDYLLGLSTFAPDLFARRDRYWEKGDPAFYELNDGLQSLGCFAFRNPVPAYRHSAAMFLHLRGWIKSDTPHPQCVRRPDSDREVLRAILERLGA